MTILRLIFAALMVLAVSTADIAYASVANDVGGAQSIAASVADVAETDHSGGHGSLRDTAGNADDGGCVDTDHCGGCALHCSALMTMDAASLATGAGLHLQPGLRFDCLLSGLVTNPERPPQVI
ncbi:hypothetical protein RDV64_23130 (plasmid) [Acuticoccus sp. MNP-M23]|uniref:hypothetical protein n=1 Tax=Acuticoccus sp. MNP-M23 TaxID=3072793 RepID=UPI0028153A77|nr:hypothetical protein [Acuticoccus sp. MNP-M23]WMS45270.1 hypothetical protein RDV64_23130 [Acuticoccus sp. MNP-M23]